MSSIASGGINITKSSTTTTGKRQWARSGTSPSDRSAGSRQQPTSSAAAALPASSIDTCQADSHFQPIVLQFGNSLGLVRIYGKVNQHYVPIILDSASTTSLISANLVSSADVLPLYRPVLLNGIGSDPVSSLGKVYVHISINNVHAVQKVLCIAGFRYPLLLGSDFLSSQKIILDFQTLTVQWKSLTLPMLKMDHASSTTLVYEVQLPGAASCSNDDDDVSQSNMLPVMRSSVPVRQLQHRRLSSRIQCRNSLPRIEEESLDDAAGNSGTESQSYSSRHPKFQ